MSKIASSKPDHHSRHNFWRTNRRISNTINILKQAKRSSRVLVFAWQLLQRDKHFVPEASSWQVFGALHKSSEAQPSTAGVAASLSSCA